MKKILFFLALFTAIGKANAQKLEFNIEGLKDTTVFLAKYFGPKLYYADTVESKNGKIVFDGSKQQGGLMAVVIPGPAYFEFLHDDEDVIINIADQKNLVGTLEVEKGDGNKAFYEYVNFMTVNQKALRAAVDARDGFDKDSKEYKKEQEKIEALNKEKLEFQKNIRSKNEGKFISTMIAMTMEIEIPDYPRDKDGNVLDSAYKYHYFINHYWDGVDFKDPKVVNTPIYHNKLDKFFSPKGVLQIPDTISYYADWMLGQMDQVDQTNKMFQYTCHHITYKYETSKIMGMDKVFWHMGVNYYCPKETTKAFWMSDENLDKMCERVNKVGRTIIGSPAPMLILTDSTEQNWINSYEIDAEYTVLYFWDPNCGHCKKVTPKLQTLYDEKFKEYGVEIYAVGKATGSDFEAWKKFIRDNGLTFINVGLTKNIYNDAMKDPRPLLEHTTLQSLNYSDTYDIYSTPRIFILDKDKKIVAKQLSIAQLEAIIDDLTGHEDAEKIFEDDPDAQEATDADH